MADIHAKLLEEKIQRALRAKRRFKAIVRHVMHNLPWLQDDDSEVIDINNVRRNVTMLTRRKKTDKGLTITEKAIMRKHSDLRTDEERKHLNKFIGGLKCFRRYPADVQFKLVAATYFEFYEAGRVLVKQDHEAHGMYFLLTGEVLISRRVWDEVSNEWTEVEIGKNVAGSIFGEVSLLHNVPRTATVTTTAPCELLCLKKEDFDNVLKATIKKQWDEINEALLKLSYFDNWNEVWIRECCLLSKLKNYDANQVILGDGVGSSSGMTAYFIIEGSCKVIEHIPVIEKMKNGIKSYELYEPQTDPVKDISLQSTEHEDKIVRTSVSLEVRGKDSQDSSKGEIEEEDIVKVKMEEILGEESEIGQENENEIGIKIRSAINQASTEETVKAQPTNTFKSSEIKAKKYSSSFSFKHARSQSSQQRNKSSIYASKFSFPPEVKTKFMQVYILNEKASFRDSIFLKNRRVIAITPVKCLLIPSYYLLQHNEANVWHRVSNFVMTHSPSRQEVFNAYVKNKKWMEYRKKLRDDILSKRKFPNNTTIHDVPYSIRVHSELD